MKTSLTTDPRVPETSHRSGAGVSRSRTRRETVRDLVKVALSRPTDENGEPVYAVAGYCENQDCEKRWDYQLVSELRTLTPVPTRWRCPECGRWLWNYRLDEHWPITGENWGCPFHPDTGSSRVGSLVTLPPLMPMSAQDYVARRPKKKRKLAGRVGGWRGPLRFAALKRKKH